MVVVVLPACQYCLALAASTVVAIVIIIVKLQPYYLVLLLLLSITPTGTKRWTGYSCLLVTMRPSAS